MPTPSMEQAKQSCLENKWTTNKKLYKNLAASGHTVYIQTEGVNPTFITPLLPVAFELSAGKDKPIEPDSQLNMELSVREQNVDCIEFGDVVDRFVLGVVTDRIKELYPGMSPAYLAMLQRRMLAPKKEFKFAPQPPYAWRFKLTKTTTYLVVVDKDEEGKEMARQGSRADVKPGCSVRVNAVLPKLYTSPASFGPNFEADVVLIYPGTGGRKKASIEDNFGFGDDHRITIVEAQEEGEGEGGAEGHEHQGGAYDDGGEASAANTAGAEGATQDANSDTATNAAGAQPAQDDDGDDEASAAKRLRSDEYE